GAFIGAAPALKIPFIVALSPVQLVLLTIEFGVCVTSMGSALAARPNAGVPQISRLSLECSGPLIWSPLRKLISWLGSQCAAARAGRYLPAQLVRAAVCAAPLDMASGSKSS